MRVERLDVAAYRVPLDVAESDGTLTWDATTVVTVEAAADGDVGLGFTYGPAACAAFIRELLADVVVGREPDDVPGSWQAMVRAVRNAGRPGVASLAIAAVDVALWDLKARHLGLPLFRLLGAVQSAVPVYASGGFCSLDDDALERQLGGWVHDDGFPRVKMKIGAGWGEDPARDVERVSVARRAIGADAELFVDANGAYTRKQAIRVARPLADEGVTWFEEPVSSDDLEGLREVRDAIDIDVAAGEYAYDVFGFARLIPVVDALQADASRCAGITEWLRAAALAASHGLAVSAHTAQSLHVHPACAVTNLLHVEYFADHDGADRLLFDGVPEARQGMLGPDAGAPGHGMSLRRTDAERYRVA